MSVLAMLSFYVSHSQNYLYEVQLSPIEIEGLGGLQSFASGSDNGEWLIIGGRLDGLHQRQPFASFDPQGNNNLIWVVNPETKEIWNTSVTNLPTNIQEQFSSTNMQFLQEGDFLMLTGGYGYAPSKGDHVTYPFLTVIDVPQVINAIKSQESILPFIKQIEDEKFQVTGGYLEKMNDKYYLVGGQLFEGRYNPMGPDHGPGFIQEYTDEIRPFVVDFSNESIEVEHFDATHDEMHLHKRDYNLVAQIDNGEDKLMAFSGVFQPTVDLPWLYPVEIASDSYTPREDFTQYFNHYHCAHVPVYNESENEMHTIFFGGIAQFYMENGVIVQDDDVPFVKTIADVVRSDSGELSEKVLSTQMPAFLGASAEFLLKEDAPVVRNGIIDGDMINEEFQEIGYIYGGINSDEKNIFFINTGEESFASSVVYKVEIKKIETVKTDDEISEIDRVMIYPNPTQGLIRMVLNLDQLDPLKVDVISPDGRILITKNYDASQLKIGKNFFVLNELKIDSGIYTIRIQSDSKTITRKVVVAE